MSLQRVKMRLIHELPAMYPVRIIFPEARSPPLKRLGVDLADVCRSLGSGL